MHLDGIYWVQGSKFLREGIWTPALKCDAKILQYVGRHGQDSFSKEFESFKRNEPLHVDTLKFFRYDIGLRAGVQTLSEDEAERLYFWGSNTGVRIHF